MNRLILISPFVLAIIVLVALIAAIPVDVLSAPPEIALAKFGQNLDRLLTFRSLPQALLEIPAMLIALVGLALLAVLYFLPAVIGFTRGKRNAPAILVLNLFLGWTLLGWVGALVWSVMSDDVNPRHAPSPQAAP